jgi:hypothetical protein
MECEISQIKISFIIKFKIIETIKFISHTCYEPWSIDVGEITFLGSVHWEKRIETNISRFLPKHFVISTGSFE